MADNRIQLLGDFVREERAAGGTITPGELVEVDSSGDFIRHNSAAAAHAHSFAIENEMQGDNITEDYLITEQTQVNYQRPGNEVYAWLAAGENAAIGDILESDGAGLLQALSGTNQQPVGFALEALDLSASGVAAARIKIKIMG